MAIFEIMADAAPEDMPKPTDDFEVNWHIGTILRDNHPDLIKNPDTGLLEPTAKSGEFIKFKEENKGYPKYLGLTKSWYIWVRDWCIRWNSCVMYVLFVGLLLSFINLLTKYWDIDELAGMSLSGKCHIAGPSSGPCAYCTFQIRAVIRVFE